MFLEDIVTLLEGAGLGTDNVSIFKSSGAVLPRFDSPVSRNGFFTVRKYGGGPDWIMENSDTVPAYERPTAQIVAHAKGSRQAELLAEKARLAFTQKRGLTVNSVYYLRIDARSVAELGVSQDNHFRYAFNIEVTKRPTPLS